MGERIRTAKQIERRLVARYQQADTQAERDRISGRLAKMRRRLARLQERQDELALVSRQMIEECGLDPCGIPWCGRVGSHEWKRTVGELKKMSVKVRGVRVEAEPVAIRCRVHVPSWRAESYVERPLRTNTQAA